MTLPFFDFWNSSATASVIGYTVREPSILISAPWANAAEAAAVTSAAAMNRGTRRMEILDVV